MFSRRTVAATTVFGCIFVAQLGQVFANTSEQISELGNLNIYLQGIHQTLRQQPNQIPASYPIGLYNQPPVSNPATYDPQALDNAINGAVTQITSLNAIIQALTPKIVKTPTTYSGAYIGLYGVGATGTYDDTARLAALKSQVAAFLNQIIAAQNAQEDGE